MKDVFLGILIGVIVMMVLGMVGRSNDSSDFAVPFRESRTMLIKTNEGKMYIVDEKGKLTGLALTAPFTTPLIAY
jgi:hypothetical protein